MPPKLLHVVATRMFCKLRPWHDDAYISQRLDIFETFTLPSFRKQTNQNFHWLLLVNPNLSQSSMSRLNGLIADAGNIHILYTDIRKELHNQKEYEHAFDEFLENLSGEYDYLLSSRIDSDDCWNIHYVEMIQKQARQLLSETDNPSDFRGALLTYPKGTICYPYQIRGKSGLAKFIIGYWSCSIDMLTTIGNRQPLYRFPHSKAKKFTRNLGYLTLKLHSSEPMWLYVQHDLNFALTDTNRWLRWFKVIEKLFFRTAPFTDESLGMFGLSSKLVKEYGESHVPSMQAATAERNEPSNS